MSATENEQLREIIRLISHKFRTPLSVVSVAAQLMDKTPLNAMQREYVKRQLRQIDTMTNILDELLDSVGEPTRHSAGE